MLTRSTSAQANGDTSMLKPRRRSEREVIVVVKILKKMSTNKTYGVSRSTLYSRHGSYG